MTVTAIHKLLLLAGICTLTGCDVDDQMLVVPIEDAGFVPIDARQPAGPQIAVLRGDPAEGPSAMLLKIGRMQGQLHYHSSDYHLVLLQGEMKHWAAEERDAEAEVLRSGSYWYQPGGQARADSCLTDECVMFIKWSGPRDAMLADEGRP